MHDLQLVGFTTDRRGLIFRLRAGARSEAGFVVPLTDELVSLVAEIAAEGATSEPAEADLRDEPAADTAVEAATRPRSQLSVRDIQARLRAGEPIARVAAEAGVEDDWIERFAPPIRAEQRRIIDQALECHLRRSRSPESAAPLRRAVGRSLADKGIAYTVDAFEAAWSAHLLGQDRWAVSFTYRHRGRDRTATWTYDAAVAELTTTDRTAAQLGFVAPGAARDDDGQSVDGLIGDPDAKTQIGTASEVAGRRRPGARTSRSSRPSSGPNRAAADGTPEPTTAKKAVAKRSATKRSATKKPAVKKAATKKPAAKKAATKKTVGKRSSAKRSAPKKTVGKRSSAKRSAPKKTVG
ncbi:MAG TPA: septation protein SepH, partial [Acidimicrobiales bacterium]